MNYDNIAASKNPGVRPIDHDSRNLSATGSKQDFEELDYSPHPLDLMAIHALCQTD